MTLLIITGTVMTLGGLAGIAWCIATVLRARRAGHDRQRMTAIMQRVIVVNLGAFAISALGLGAIIAGLLLG